MRERKPHMLTPSDGSDRPQNVLFFDTETQAEDLPDKVQRHTLRLGVAQYYRQTRGKALGFQSELVFRDVSEFWDYVDGYVRKKSTLIITAHNIVFDLAVLNGFVEMAERGYTLESFYTKGMVSIFRWKRGNSKVVGIDNGNLFPGKLREWGDLLGFPKGQVEFSTVDDTELITYCRRDVEIMVKCWLSWLAFLDDRDCGSFKFTVGSTAFNTWRHRFLKKSIYIHADPLAIELERQSYRGGRVEVLYKGRLEGDRYHYLDINNMYGYVLSRYMYPAGFMGSAKSDSVSMLVRKLEKYAVTARVTINTSEPAFPYHLDGVTCYPVGRFTTTLTTPELYYVIQNGWLESVQAFAWYQQESLFSSYVDEFYNLRIKYRSEGNKPYAQICKLLVNSLYGKFGQQGFDQKIIGETDPQDIWSESVYDVDHNIHYRHISIAGKIFEERKAGESYNSFVAISAHVTAYARMYLWRLIKRVDPGHVFYMDTDSLIVDDHGMKQLASVMDEGKLGALKVELSSDWLEVNAAKDYAMEGRKRLKGVPVGSKETSPGVFELTHWERLAGSIQKGHQRGYYTRTITKRQNRRITSGVLTPSGWVVPFVLDLAGSGLSEVPDLLPSLLE